MKNIPLYLLILVVLSGISSTSCAWKKDFRQGQKAFEKKDWDSAVSYFLKALNEKPGNVEYRVSLVNAMISASNYHLKKGKQYLEDGNYKPALIAFEKALEYNPENNEARNQKFRLLKRLRKLEKEQREKSEIQQLKEKAEDAEITKPKIEYKKKPYSLKFNRADLKQIFKALEKSSGITFIFDESFKSKKVTIDLNKVNFLDALKIIMIQSRLFYKVIDPKTVIIAPDTTAKRKTYDELVMKTFFINSGNVEEIAKNIRTLCGIKTVALDKESNTIIMKGLPGEVELAERIAKVLDKPQGEVFIDLEIIEVNRTRAQEYGIELSQYELTQAYLPETGTGTDSTTSTIRLHRVGHTDASDYLLTLPTVSYKLLKSDRNSRIKARPQLRIINKHKSEVHLGDKVPIPTTSFVPYNTQGLAQQPITSYQLQDVGINITITPEIHLDGLITIELEFELTFITSPGTDTVPPTLGNRSVKTLIRLRDNETSMLAGLLRDVERQTVTGFPLVSQVPILKDIFSGNVKELEQTDIILTITPKIVRFPEINEEDLELLWVGTQDRIELKSPPVELNLEDEEEEEAPETQKTPTKESAKPKKSKPKKTAKKEIKEKEKSSNSEPTKTTPPQAQPIHLLLQDTGQGLKKDVETDVPFSITGDGNVRAITLEMDFDPSLIQVLDARKGEILTQERVKSLLLRNIDNQSGKIKLNISLDQPLKMTGQDTGQLVVMRVKPLKKGKILFKPTVFRVLDINMKKIESETPEKSLELKAEE